MVPGSRGCSLPLHLVLLLVGSALLSLSWGPGMANYPARVEQPPGPRAHVPQDPGLAALRARYWPLLLEAASYHNPWPEVSTKILAEVMLRILVAEAGGDEWVERGWYQELIYPLWNKGIQVLANDLLGTNGSVGVAQLRPETAAQLQQGWIDHAGRRIYHGISLRYAVAGQGPLGISSRRLAEDKISIEFLAANLAMGAAVARAHGVEPTVEDLARWHNTGMGPWNLAARQTDPATWGKGSAYAGKVLALAEGLPLPRPSALVAAAPDWPEAL